MVKSPLAGRWLTPQHTSQLFGKAAWKWYRIICNAPPPSLLFGLKRYKWTYSLWRQTRLNWKVPTGQKPVYIYIYIYHKIQKQARRFIKMSTWRQTSFKRTSRSWTQRFHTVQKHWKQPQQDAELHQSAVSALLAPTYKTIDRRDADSSSSSTHKTFQITLWTHQNNSTALLRRRTRSSFV